MEPEAVVWWPQAPGWRILAVAALLAVGVAAWRRWRRWRRDAYRREALKALRDCRNLSPQARLQTTARILKAAALAAFPLRILVPFKLELPKPKLAILAQDCERWLSGHRKATQ